MATARPPTILCIDDEPNALVIRKLLFQRAGYTVFAALNTATALKLFQDNHFDVVVSDHLFPNETGAELARQIKLLDPHVPVVLLSGSIEPPESSAIADAFVVKGDDPFLLLERVASLLRLASHLGDDEARSRDLQQQISHFRRGDHVCFAYESHAEQMQAVVPWIEAGLRRGERCRYFADDNTVSEVSRELEKAGVNVKRECDRGALEFATKHESYLRSGCFEPGEMIDLLQQDIDDSIKAGFSRYRVSGEMTWCLGLEPGCDRVLEYESLLDGFFQKSSALGLCQFSRNRFSSSLLSELAAEHHLGLNKSNNGARWNLRIREGELFADMLENRETQAVQYCIQRNGSTDVLELGSGRSLSETRRTIEARLRSFSRSVN